MSDQRNPALRASDADRERVAGALREHCAVGRLTMAELDERLAATYAARTLGDLQKITHDLPEIPPELPVAVHSRPGRRDVSAQYPLPSEVDHRSWLSLPSAVASWLAMSIVLTVIWGLASAPGYFWPGWPIGIGGAVLIGNYFKRNAR